MISFSVSIAHASHKPERKPILAKMVDAMAFREGDDRSGYMSGTPDSWLELSIEDGPGKPHEWSLRQWEKAIEKNRTHCVLLNDDLHLCDRFINVLHKELSYGTRSRLWWIMTRRYRHVLRTHSCASLRFLLYKI